MVLSALARKTTGLVASAALFACSAAHANYFGFSGVVENQTYQLEFTPRVSQNFTYWATMSVSSIGGYGGIQQHGSANDHWGLFSLWDSSGTVKDSLVAGLNPFISFSGSADHRFGGEGTGSQLLFVFDWQLGKPYRMAWRRFVVPGSTKVRYSNFYYDSHVAGGWVWVGMFERPQTSSGARNMNGFETFSERFGEADGTREIDYRNVWLLDLDDHWRNISHAVNDDARDQGQLWPIAGGWRHHSYDPAYTFQTANDVPMKADSTLVPIHVPYWVNSGANTQPSIAPSDQVGSSLTHSFEPDAYWNGSSSANSTNAAIDVSGVANAAPVRLYQTWRQGDSFGYTLFGLKPNSATTVRLHFVEPTYEAVGVRRQKVVINGATVESNLDIRAAAGARNKALVRTYSVRPGADGKVSIALVSLVAGVPALLAGLEAGSVAGAGGGAFQDGVYRMTPKISATRALDNPVTNASDGTPFQISSWLSGANQKFNIVSAGNGYYKMQLMNDRSQVVDVSAAASADGTQVQSWVDNGTKAQRWRLQDLGNGYHKLKPECAPDSALDVHSSNPNNGARVIIWRDHGGDNQQWKLERQ